MDVTQKVNKVTKDWHQEKRGQMTEEKNWKFGIFRGKQKSKEF